MELESSLFKAPARIPYRHLWIVSGLVILAQFFLVVGLSIWFAREVTILKERISALETVNKMMNGGHVNAVESALKQNGTVTNLKHTTTKDGVVTQQMVENETISEQNSLNNSQTATGAVYIRWGRSECPSGSSLLYRGEAAGSFYKNKGGGSNYQCLPEDPDYVAEESKAFTAKIYGAEYQDRAQPELYDHNVPCAVCMANQRSAMVMIPAKISCPDSSWTREYYGHLMTEANHHNRATYECVDQDRQTLNGTSSNNNGALFFNVKGNCDEEGQLFACPKYQARTLACVVCTK